MAIIRQLKNFFTKQVIYPKTLTKAVYDEGGERLDKILRDTMLATDNEEYSGVEPRDADTLGGKYKASDIEKIKGDVSKLNNDLTKLIVFETVEYNFDGIPGNSDSREFDLSQVTIKNGYELIALDWWFTYPFAWYTALNFTRNATIGRLHNSVDSSSEGGILVVRGVFLKK